MATISGAEALVRCLIEERVRYVFGVPGDQCNPITDAIYRLGRKEVKIDLTPLWLKLQTIKGVYCFGYTDLRGKKEHVFEIAIDLVKQKKVSLEPMVTHTFPLEHYREMIEVNMRKGKYKAVKTMVSFA